jgi:uncharacterized membrane protein (UPF0182 family)
MDRPSAITAFVLAIIMMIMFGWIVQHFPVQPNEPPLEDTALVKAWDRAHWRERYLDRH